MDLGSQIQMARRNRSLSVEELAAATSVSVGTIRAIEQGRRKPSAATFAKIQDELLMQGEWVSEDTWQDAAKYKHVLTRFPGDNRPAGFRSSTKDSEFRLSLINQIMTADIENLRVVSTLLSRLEA